MKVFPHLWLSLLLIAALSQAVAGELVPVSTSGTTTTASGLKYRVLRSGTGENRPGLEDSVTIHYSGKLADGTEFDNTRKRGRPASFAINRVIEGWSEGLQLMREGALYQFIIPPELAFGHKGLSGMIEPDSTLIFDIELIKIIHAEDQASQ